MPKYSHGCDQRLRGSFGRMKLQLRCPRSHEGCNGSLVEITGGDGAVLAGLLSAKCPLCPGQSLLEVDEWQGEGAVRRGLCECCGSSWRITPSDYECLPGPSVELLQR